MGLIIDNSDMHRKFLDVYNLDYMCETNKGKKVLKKIFVDKSNILNDFNKLINKDKKYVCITKPRRFGKTSIAAMLVSYYSKGIDCKEIFDQLNVAKGKSSDKKENEWERKQYAEFQNKFHTLYFDFSYDVKRHNNLDDYLASINAKLKEDVEELFPDSKVLKKYKDTIYENLKYLCNETGEQFILIIDEWDYIITSSEFSRDDKDKYISYLRYLIKDQGYIAFTYMTGITPIAKELSHSTLNCFMEYSMIEDDKYYQYFGFTEEEVKDLCENNKTISYEKLEEWYNGYKGPNGEKIFNPWSVCHALDNNKIGNYWSNSGRDDELVQTINLNINGIRDEILSLITKEKKSITLRKYGAEDIQKELKKNNEKKNNDKMKKELYSKMVTYGYLTYYKGEISIPNEELLQKFILFLNDDDDLKYYYNLIENSKKMIEATIIHKNAQEVCEILEDSHLNKIKPGDKLDHGSLKRIMDYVFFNIRKEYDVEEEEGRGKGTIDLIYYPKNRKKEVFIIELKVNGTAKSAIDQIHKNKYYHNLNNKGYNENILLVGISYQNKTYGCIIEECTLKDNKLETFYESSYILESQNKRKNISDHDRISKRLRSSSRSNNNNNNNNNNSDNCIIIEID